MWHTGTQSIILILLKGSSFKTLTWQLHKILFYALCSIFRRNYPLKRETTEETDIEILRVKKPTYWILMDLQQAIQFPTSVWPISLPLPNNNKNSQKRFYSCLLEWNSLKQEDFCIATTGLALYFVFVMNNNPIAMYAASKCTYHYSNLSFFLINTCERV